LYIHATLKGWYNGADITTEIENESISRMVKPKGCCAIGGKDLG
jgi:hypothetical protein